MRNAATAIGVGTVDVIESTTNSYDPRGNLLASILELVFDGNGTTDQAK